MPKGGLSNNELMRLAIEEASKAPWHGDVPVGALVVFEGQIVASRHNEREKQNDPTAHAELLAIRDATTALGSWRLTNHTVISTLEPCIMCAGALQQARIERLVFGAPDPKAGACGSLYNVACDPRLNHEFSVSQGVLETQCAELLQNFFASQRKVTNV